MDSRPLIGHLHVWDAETHELLGIQEPGVWLSEVPGVPKSWPLFFISTSRPPEGCDCGCEGQLQKRGDE